MRVLSEMALLPNVGNSVMQATSADQSALNVSRFGNGWSFLLVGVAGACVHVPPPPPNQIVLVQMPAGKGAKVFWQEPVWVVGKLRIETADSPYCDVSYRMTGHSVELAKEFR